MVDDIVGKLKGVVESKKVGDPENEDTELGPLVSEKQKKVLEFTQTLL